MNCFEWQSNSSDFLDRTLSPTLSEEADRHLATCDGCSQKRRRYQDLVQAIGTLPKSALPIPMRKAPLGNTIHALDGKTSPRLKWQQTPWYIRSGVEGLGIAFMILFVIAMIPRIRTFYEQSMERRLDAFNIAEFMQSREANPEDLAGNTPLTRGKLTDTAQAQLAQQNALPQDDFDGEEEDHEDSADTTTSPQKIRVGTSEIWRFNLKTDSPHEVRPQIVKVLAQAGVAAETSGIGGIEAPGGIQFDLLVPAGTIAAIKTKLQTLSGTLTHGRNPAAAAAVEKADPPISGEDFTWYKSKSKRTVPPGQARVVIWLSLT